MRQVSLSGIVEKIEEQEQENEAGRYLRVS
jgi:hypothetical protein